MSDLFPPVQYTIHINATDGVLDVAPGGDCVWDGRTYAVRVRVERSNWGPSDLTVTVIAPGGSPTTGSASARDGVGVGPWDMRVVDGIHQLGDVHRFSRDLEQREITVHTEVEEEDVPKVIAAMYIAFHPQS